MAEGGAAAVAVAAAAAVLALVVVQRRQQQQHQQGKQPALSSVATESAPQAIGPYVQATKDGMGTVYVSGQVGFDPESMRIDGETAGEQAEQVLKNLRAILEAAGSGMDQVLKTTVLLADIRDYAEVNKAYERAFGTHKPARAAFAVRDLPAGALVEIDCIALERK